MAPFFSIIVLAYNCESTLARTLLSIGRQSFKDYEVVVVDNGATDGSFSIASSFAGADSRIKIYRFFPNKGPSYGYNQGIAMAQGRYVISVDGDDEIGEDTLASAYETIAAFDPDIVEFRVDFYQDSKRIYTYHSRHFYVQGNDIQQAVLAEDFPIAFTHNGKAIRSSLLKQKELAFVNGPRGEDSRVIRKVLFLTQSLVFDPRCVWIYHQSKNSYSHFREADGDEQFAYQLLLMRRYLDDLPFYKAHSLGVFPIWTIKKYVFDDYASLLFQHFSDRKKRKLIRQIGKYTWINRLYFFDLKEHSRFSLFLLCLLPRAAYLLMKIKHHSLLQKPE